MASQIERRKFLATLGGRGRDCMAYDCNIVFLDNFSDLTRLAWRWEIARDALREAEEWRKETLLREAPAAEGLHEGWWRKRDEIWRQREGELEREKWRKRDEKAAETWRRVNAEKTARGER